MRPRRPAMSLASDAADAPVRQGSAARAGAASRAAATKAEASVRIGAVNLMRSGAVKEKTTRAVHAPSDEPQPPRGLDRGDGSELGTKWPCEWNAGVLNDRHPGGDRHDHGERARMLRRHHILRARDH